jgi:sulfur carrier protein
MTGTPLTVNGTPRDDLPETLIELIRAEGLAPDRRGLAVAVNGRVVPRGAWAETRLEDGDSVEIVKPFSGG